MKVIAEGIETVEQLDFLKKAGCDIGQGYLIARPMDKTQLEDWLAGLTSDNLPPAWSMDTSLG